MAKNGICSVNPGEKYGRLTVVELSHIGNKHKKYFKCLCECGNTSVVCGEKLKSGRIKSCGCIAIERSVKVSEKYGRLTVVKYSHSDIYRNRVYECICECGNTTFVKGSRLKNGGTESCGCYSSEVHSELCKARILDKHPRWLGGISFEPYCVLFNREFKDRVRDFFGRKCVECGKTEEEEGKKLSVHHVNFRKDSCCAEDAPRLFVSLCASCHAKTNTNRDYWEEYFTTMINEQYNGQCYLPKAKV